MSYNDDAKLEKKLAKVSNQHLKELIVEAQKTREELGDRPEIKNIERSIVREQSNANKRIFAAGMKLLAGIALMGIGGYYVLSTGDQASFQTISNLVVFAIGGSMTLGADIAGQHVSTDKIALIKNDFGKIKNENENAEVEENARRR